MLYPSYADSRLPQVIKYEKDIVVLRKAALAKRKEVEVARAEKRRNPEWKRRVRSQGPWDEEKDPLALTGVSALPMPVEIRYVGLGGVLEMREWLADDGVSGEESLRAFFDHLSGGGTHDTLNVRGFSSHLFRWVCWTIEQTVNL